MAVITTLWKPLQIKPPLSSLFPLSLSSLSLSLSSSSSFFFLMGGECRGGVGVVVSGRLSGDFFGIAVLHSGFNTRTPPSQRGSGHWGHYRSLALLHSGFNTRTPPSQRGSGHWGHQGSLRWQFRSQGSLV